MVRKVGMAVAAGLVFGASLSCGAADVSPLLLQRQYQPSMSDEDFDVKPWQEIESGLPPAPRPENLLAFHVSAVATSRFLIDASTLSVGKDGVVRYVLVIETSGGARNVSFEGIRCDTWERRLYAFGRPDGSWSKARSNQWTGIRNPAINQYHAVLGRNYFCPNGVAILSAEEGVGALKAGGHPAVPH